MHSLSRIFAAVEQSSNLPPITIAKCLAHFHESHFVFAKVRMKFAQMVAQFLADAIRPVAKLAPAFQFELPMSSASSAMCSSHPRQFIARADHL